MSSIQDQKGFAQSLKEAQGDFSLHENILSIFEKIKNEQANLSFLNLYKDVPVKSYGKVVEIEDDFVICEVDPIQMLAIMEEKNAYIIKNDYISKHVRADIAEYNMSEKTIKLGNFIRFSNMPANQRKHTRVHPHENTSIKLSKENESIEGILYDISDGGMTFLSKDRLSCQKGDILKTTFTLCMPDSSEKVQINLDLEVVLILDYGSSFRYCMKSVPNQEHLNFISKFTKKRELDTIANLKNKIQSYQ